MNETINTILNRRSTRNYLPEQIEQDELDLIIKAGLYAPSGHNAQPWHFTVIQNRKVIDDLNAATKEIMLKSDDEYLQNVGKNDKFNIFYNAPTIIVISGEEKAPLPKVDCAAATQNMLLAAESINMGSCWIGFVIFLFVSNEVQKYIDLFKIPEGYVPYYAITLGYKAQKDLKSLPRREGTVNYFKG